MKRLGELEREKMRGSLGWAARQRIETVEKKLQAMSPKTLATWLDYFDDAEEFPNGCEGFAQVLQALCEERALKIFRASHKGGRLGE